MAASQTISIRLGVDGAQEVKSALEGLGTAADATSQRVKSSLEALSSGDVGGKLASQLTAAATRIAALQKALDTAATSGNTEAQVAIQTRLTAAMSGYAAILDRTKASISPLAAAEQARAKTIADATNAVKAGAATEEEAAAARTRAQATYDKQTQALQAVESSSRNANTQMRLLGVQAIQTASGLATGQPILTTLIQQGHQVADSLLATGTGFGALKGAFSGAVSAIGPLNIALLATYAALATLGAGAEHESQRLSNLRQQLRATHDDYATLATSVDASAKQIAATTTASITDARTAAQTIASAAYFKGTQADIVNLATVSLNLAKIWNEDVAKSAEFLKGALDDPGKAAQELADKHFRGMTQALATSVAQMQTAGHASDGLNVVLGVLQKGTSGATDDQSKLGTALKNLEKSFYGAQDGGKSLATALGDFVDVQAARVVVGLNDVINAVVRASTAVGNAVSAAKAAQSQYNSGSLDAPVSASGGSASGVPSGQQVLQGPPIKNSTERALGIFQVLPSTGRDMGYDVTDPTQNVKAGITYLDQLVSRLGVDAGLAQYGGYGKNVTKAQDYISNVLGSISAADSVLPENVLKQIQTQGTALGKSPGIIEIAKGLATVESSGKQYTTGPTDFGRGGASYSGSIVSATGTNNVTGVTAGGYDTMSQPGASQSMIDEQKKWNDELDKSAQKTREITNAGYDKFIDTLTAQMKVEAATTGTDTAAYREHQEILDRVRAERYKNVDAITTEQRASESSLRASAGELAADQKLNAAIEARNQVLLQSTGVGISASQADQVRTNVLKEQNQEFGRTTAAIVIATANSAAMAAAYDKGNQAVVDATAFQSAYNEGLKEYGRNIPAAKLQELIELYKRQAVAANEAKVAQQNLASRDNLAYIQTETSSLGMNEDARNRLLAVMKAEQAMHAQFGTDLPKEAQEYIRLAAATADATSAFQHQQAVTSEMGTFFTNTFDTISNSITSAFANGTESALKFKDIAKSVASAVLSEFVKLAVVNPLKNLLFGSTNSTVTLSDVLGFLGGGTTSSLGSSSSGSGVSELQALGFLGTSVSGGAIQGVQVSSSGSSSGTSGDTSGGALGAVSSVAGIASFGDKLGLFGGSGGEGIVSRVSDKIATFITDQIGNTGIANDIAANALGEGGDIAGSALGDTGGTISGLARVAASVADSVGASTETAGQIASVAGQIGDALPYIGTAISVVTDLIQGNYLKAGTTTGGALAGAAIGTWVFPGLGTAAGAAIGAIAGSLLGSFLGGHAKNSYQGTEVMVDNGQVVAGKTVAQVQSSDDAVKSINDFGSALDGYMSAVGVQLTNLNGTLGDVGQGIKGMTQYTSVADPAIFSKLQFAPNASDTSNFGVAKGALVDMQFNSITDLNNEVIKIAGFAEAASAMGIQLKHVAKDISNIQIASVTGGNANALGSVTDAQGNLVQYHNDLRTALNSDLPSQTFADTTALDTEISKVNTFVNTTLPQLLTPIEQTSSSITTAVDNIDKTYNEAIQQSLQYGLDNTAVLRQAEAEAISIVRRTALMSLTQNQTSIVNRFLTATNDNVYTQQQATLDALLATQANEIESYTKSWTDIFGDGVKSTAQFQAALGTLVTTLGAEYSSKLAATNKAIQAQYDSLWQSFQSNYMVRDLQAQGDNKDADLLSYDVKAEQERQTYIDQQEAFWGDQLAGNQGFQDQLALIDKVHGEERLAIVQKYATATTTALDTTLTQAQGNVTTLLGNLKTYALSLQTGSDSPLSPNAQYALAAQQFKAVKGAAAAGDYNSASQLQTYAQNFVSASRAVYGSGAQYASDVSSVVDALGSVAANTDALTVSAQKQIAQEQTAAIVDSVKALQDQVAGLQAELTATRRELMNTTRAAALAA